MGYYDKKVVYLSYIECGLKMKSAGYIKLENSDNSCRLDMHISGVTGLKDGQYDIQLTAVTGEKYKVGQVGLYKGSGSWAGEYRKGTIGDTGIGCKDAAAFRVELADDRAIEGRIKHIVMQERTEERGKKEQKKRWEGKKAEAIWKGAVHRDGGTKSDLKDVSKDGSGEEPAGGLKREKELMKEFCYERSSEQGQKAVRPYTKEAELKAGSIRLTEEEKGPLETERSNTSVETRQKEIQMDKAILNDKWQQLMQLYPIIHPYEDKREYITIAPKDFVIMTGDYQHLANNSFLLHGYYNYRHIILGQEKEQEQDREEREKENETGGFYLGVPGVYYEREKMVALMFGFEAFECVGGKAEPGKFGYYLRRVRI